jgi:23S rRNA (guanine745-N1)-methyltransferase
VVDLGSGTGDALAEVAAERPTVGIGIDLSTAAAEHAARRSPHLTWVVANADRRLPLLDQTVDLVLSLHGRRNPSECARVLIDGGCVLVALPGADDLIELRALVQGSGLARPRGDRMLAEHRPYFDLVRQIPVRETVDLDRQAVQQVLRSTYRGARRAEVSRVEQLEGVRATVSADLFVLRRGQAR